MAFKANNRLEIERQTLADLLKFPDIFGDIDAIIKEGFYSTKLHQVIFGTIRSCLINNEPIDKTTISNRIANLNLVFEVDVYDYLCALESIQLNRAASLDRFKELAKIWGKQQIFEKTEEIQKYLNNSANDSFDYTLSTCDTLYSQITNSFNLNSDPEDLFEGMKEYIEELGDKETFGIKMPFPKFQKYFGELENGTLTLFVAGYKVGKSWWLLNLLKRLTTENENVEGLYIDTEMKKKEVMRRMCAEIAGVNEYYLRHGWKRNPELIKKVRAVWPIVENFFGKIQHLYVGNISQEETESIIRRWTWKKRAANPNVNPVVVYDYFKLIDQDAVKDAFASSMVLGVKVDRTKKIANELNIPIIAAAQTNAAGEIGLSREIGKFVDSAFKLKKRSIEEIEIEGGLGTHKIEPICNRSLGAEIGNFDTDVKIGKDREGKTIYSPNAIIYSFRNFRVEELNTLQEQMALQLLPQRKIENKNNLF